MSCVPLHLHDFLGISDVVLMDCEFACWEDSLATGWADLSRPPEVIEIGLVHYDLHRGTIGKRFTSLVRPRLNRELSTYCKSLIGINQDEIDRAPSLAEVLLEVEGWLLDLERSATPTCAWGMSDRSYFAEDARRWGLRSPFDGAPHADLNAFSQQLFRDGDRESVRTRYGLHPIPHRHRALADALDLIQFCTLVRDTARQRVVE